MIGKPRRLGALDERFQPLQMIAIQPLRRAEIQGDAMLDHPVAIENPVQGSEWTPAVHHEVLRNDLEPIHHRLPLEYMLVVRNAQADADTVFGESVKPICGHSNARNKGSRL